jgi:hypothetical protein
VAKDLVQNPDFGQPDKGPQPTHIWVDRPEPAAPLITPGGGADYGIAGIIFLPFVWLAFLPLAYPLLTVAVFATWWVSREFSEARFRGWADGPKLALLIVPAFIVFVIGMRIEQRLGTWKVYRWPRYWLRIVLPAFLLVLVAEADSKQVDPDFATLISHVAHDSQMLAGVCVIVVVMMVLYWIGGWTRDWWHIFLRRVGLRSSKLKER